MICFCAAPCIIVKILANLKLCHIYLSIHVLNLLCTSKGMQKLPLYFLGFASVCSLLDATLSGQKMRQATLFWFSPFSKIMSHQLSRIFGYSFENKKSRSLLNVSHFSCYILLLIKLFYLYLDYFTASFWPPLLQLLLFSLSSLAQTLAGDHWSCVSFPTLPTLGNRSSCPDQRPLGPWDPVLSRLRCFFDAPKPATAGAAKESAFFTTTHSSLSSLSSPGQSMFTLVSLLDCLGWWQLRSLG